MMSLTENSRAKLKKITEFSVKILFVVLGCIILYRKIFGNEQNMALWDDVAACLGSHKSVFLICIALFLMIFNLFLEAVKWQKVISPIESVPMSRAIPAIFTGITAGMFFPNRLGDFIGRVFVLEKGSRIKGSIATMIGTFAQLVVTLCFGCIAFIFFIPSKHIIINVLIAITAVFILVFLFLNIKFLRHIQKIIPKRFRGKTEHYIGIFSDYSRRDLAILLLWSAARYLVYSFQFVLLIWAFGIPMTYFQAIVPIAVTYFMMTVIPFVTILEIAVRGSVSILVFEQWMMSIGICNNLSIMVFTASSLLWMINLGLPALIGIFNVNKIKIFRR